METSNKNRPTDCAEVVRSKLEVLEQAAAAKTKTERAIALPTMRQELLANTMSKLTEPDNDCALLLFRRRADAESCGNAQGIPEKKWLQQRNVSYQEVREKLR